MSKLKALVGLAPDVAKAAKRAPLNPDSPPRMRFMDQFEEYQATQSAIDARSAPSPVPTALDLEIAQKEAAQAESARIEGISSPEARPSTAHQSLNPEEFRTRLELQLMDPAFGVKAADGELDSFDLARLADSGTAHRQRTRSMLTGLRQNERWGARYDQWVEDSPYKEQVFFHTDKWTDPTRSDTFVQFENPREFGLHAGTLGAAERFVGFGGAENAMKVQQEFADDIAEIASLAGLEVKDVHRAIGKQVEAHFVNRFTRGQDGPPNADEWAAILDRVDFEVGDEAAEALDKILKRMKQQPTPNTTPMVFRGKNGLYLQDQNANFRPETVVDQLLDIFPDDADEIFAAAGGTIQESTKKLQAFIESKGFDHIVYHNAVEDRGSLSIINWNPELQKSLWDAELAGVNPTGHGRAAAQAWLGMTGVGAGNAAIQSDE